MVQYEQQQQVRTKEPAWVRWSAMSAVVGGAVTALVSLSLFTVLNPQEFAIVEPPAIVAGFLLAFGLAAYYVTEHQWFGRLAKVSFAVMALGTIVVAVTLPIATYGPGIVFLGYLLGTLITMLGAMGFGVAMLRADAMPRAAAWLLIATLPVGVPLALGFTTYVMGETAEPWAGAFLFFGLAWALLGRYVLARRDEVESASVRTTPQ